MMKDNYNNQVYVFTSEFRSSPIFKIGKSDESINRCDKWNKDIQKIENRDLKEFKVKRSYSTLPGTAFKCETWIRDEVKIHFKKVPGTSRETFFGTFEDLETTVITPELLEELDMKVNQLTPDIHKIVRMSDDGLRFLVKYDGYKATTRETIDKLNQNPYNRKKIDIYKKKVGFEVVKKKVGFKSIIKKIIDRSEDGNDWTVELTDGKVIKTTLEKLNVVPENKDILNGYEETEGIYEIDEILSYYRGDKDNVGEYLVLFVGDHYEWVSPTPDFKQSIDTFHSENIIVDCRVNSTRSEYLVKNTKDQQERWVDKNYLRRIDIDTFHKPIEPYR